MNLPFTNAGETDPGLLILLLLGLVTIGLLGLVLSRPQLVQRGFGKGLVLLAFVALPLMFFFGGMQEHVHLSKQTEFCVSCHVMEPYGESLLIDDSEYLPASHYQNRRIPTEQACFTCHTTYTMYGDWAAKFRGLRHLWVNYVGTIPETLALYGPYQNRECLHCHAGARSFEENDLHVEVRAELANDEMSCLECHDRTHRTHELASLPRWEVAQTVGDSP